MQCPITFLYLKLKINLYLQLSAFRFITTQKQRNIKWEKWKRDNEKLVFVLTLTHQCTSDLKGQRAVSPDHVRSWWLLHTKHTAASSVGFHRQLARSARPAVCKLTRVGKTKTPLRSKADQTLRPTLVLACYIRPSTVKVPFCSIATFSHHVRLTHLSLGLHHHCPVVRFHLAARRTWNKMICLHFLSVTDQICNRSLSAWGELKEHDWTFFSSPFGSDLVLIGIE